MKNSEDKRYKIVLRQDKSGPMRMFGDGSWAESGKSCDTQPEAEQLARRLASKQNIYEYAVLDSKSREVVCTPYRTTA